MRRPAAGPGHWNVTQVDSDSDGMGNECDPQLFVAPSSPCDGVNDLADGWGDADGDGWGDPCDHHPLRDDSYPGAPELCDGRDNDGDGLLAPDERIDEDYDEGVVCGDCDDLEPLANVCQCEACGNLIDDDCDVAIDEADSDCEMYPACIVMASGAEPGLSMGKGECGGATLSGPFDVVRGSLEQVQFSGGSVDLGDADCVGGAVGWDRVTDYSLNPNPRCEALPALYYLGKNTADTDYGAASSGERRDLTNPDPVCP